MRVVSAQELLPRSNKSTADISLDISKIKSSISKLPVGVFSLITACCAVFLLNQIRVLPAILDSNNQCSNPSSVIDYQFYRFIGHLFHHGNVLHLFMNMLSLESLGTPFEKEFGTVGLFLMVFVLAVVGGFIEFILALSLTNLSGYYSFFYECAIGFSDVLFGLTVIDSMKHKQSLKSVFGVITVNSRVYPFLMIFLLQIVFPSSSLVGHVSGALAGAIISTCCNESWFLYASETPIGFEAIKSLRKIITTAVPAKSVNTLNKSTLPVSSSSKSNSIQAVQSKT